MSILICVLHSNGLVIKGGEKALKYDLLGDKIVFKYFFTVVLGNISYYTNGNE